MFGILHFVWTEGTLSTQKQTTCSKDINFIDKFSQFSKFLIIKTTKLLSIEWPNLFVADPLWGGGGREGGG